MIIWNVLATDSAYTDLGADFYVHRNDPDRQTRRLIAKLEADRKIDPGKVFDLTLSLDQVAKG